ncbi:TPA: TrbM/KikA/MpfK family conjugal transfer protein [Neisseria subflava]
MKFISTIIALVMGFSSVTSMAANPLNPPQMGGDERLACEALMCLVNPASQPSECQSALRKFHSIKHKHGHDTITARRNFLKKCPAQDRSGFDDFIDSIIK